MTGIRFSRFEQTEHSRVPGDDENILPRHGARSLLYERPSLAERLSGAVDFLDLPIGDVGVFLAGSEHIAVHDALDVSEYGGWRAYIASL